MFQQILLPVSSGIRFSLMSLGCLACRIIFVGWLVGYVRMYICFLFSCRLILSGRFALILALSFFPLPSSSPCFSFFLPPYFCHSLVVLQLLPSELLSTYPRNRSHLYFSSYGNNGDTTDLVTKQKEFGSLPTCEVIALFSHLSLSINS